MPSVPAENVSGGTERTKLRYVIPYSSGEDTTSASVDHCVSNTDVLCFMTCAHYLQIVVVFSYR